LDGVCKTNFLSDIRKNVFLFQFNLPFYRFLNTLRKFLPCQLATSFKFIPLFLFEFLGLPAIIVIVTAALKFDDYGDEN
jgi:hypothetical protein